MFGGVPHFDFRGTILPGQGGPPIGQVSTSVPPLPMPSTMPPPMPPTVPSLALIPKLSPEYCALKPTPPTSTGPPMAYDLTSPARQPENLAVLKATYNQLNEHLWDPSSGDPITSMAIPPTMRKIQEKISQFCELPPPSDQK